MKNSLFLYIDPQTGAMLFSILLGTVGAAVYFIRMLIIKVKQKIFGGKAEESNITVPFAIFAEDKRYWNVFRPICRELNSLGKDVLYLTGSEDDPVNDAGYEHIKIECISNQYKMFARLNYLNAVVLLSTTPGLDVYQWKRSPDVKYYVHIPHSVSENVMYRMFGIDHYDAILTSGECAEKNVRLLERMRGLSPKELVRVGIPYLDENKKRFDAEKEFTNRFSDISGNKEDKNITVLLAPTWGPNSIFQAFGEKILEKLTETNYHIIVRPHPQSYVSEKEMIEKLQSDFPESDRLEWNRDSDNFSVLNRSDILISDYSGVVYDYALVFEKPVIYKELKLDLSVYDAWWLKRADNSYTLWMESALPRLGFELTEEGLEHIEDIIASCISDSRFVEGRKEVIEEIWASEGKGAENIANYLLKKYNQLTYNAFLEG